MKRHLKLGKMMTAIVTLGVAPVAVETATAQTYLEHSPAVDSKVMAAANAAYAEKMKDPTPVDTEALARRLADEAGDRSEEIEAVAAKTEWTWRGLQESLRMSAEHRESIYEAFDREDEAERVRLFGSILGGLQARLAVVLDYEDKAKGQFAELVEANGRAAPAFREAEQALREAAAKSTFERPRKFLMAVADLYSNRAMNAELISAQELPDGFDERFAEIREMKAAVDLTKRFIDADPDVLRANTVDIHGQITKVMEEFEYLTETVGIWSDNIVRVGRAGDEPLVKGPEAGRGHFSMWTPTTGAPEAEEGGARRGAEGRR